MTPAELKSLAVPAYGPWWQSQLARDLDVAIRTVQRWAGGHVRIPEARAEDIPAICLARARGNFKAVRTGYGRLFRQKIKAAKAAKAAGPQRRWRPLASGGTSPPEPIDRSSGPKR